MDYCTHGNVLQGQSITHLGSSFSTTHHSGTHLQSVGSNNITFFTICVVQQSDTSRTVRIILDCLYHSRHTILLTSEIHKTELPLVASTDIAHGHLTCVVTTT